MRRTKKNFVAKKIIGRKIDRVWNFMTESSAYFFVFILNFVFTSVVEIKIFVNDSLSWNNFFSQWPISNFFTNFRGFTKFQQKILSNRKILHYCSTNQTSLREIKRILTKLIQSHFRSKIHRDYPPVFELKLPKWNFR